MEGHKNLRKLTEQVKEENVFENCLKLNTYLQPLSTCVYSSVLFQLTQMVKLHAKTLKQTTGQNAITATACGFLRPLKGG